VFFFIAVFAFPPTSYDPGTEAEVWPKFFQLPVLMLMLITLLNDGTLITIGYDYVIPSSRPEKWNLRVSNRTLGLWDLLAGYVHRLLCLLKNHFHAFGSFYMVVRESKKTWSRRECHQRLCLFPAFWKTGDWNGSFKLEFRSLTEGSSFCLA
jgi:hypothetical protein